MSRHIVILSLVSLGCFAALPTPQSRSTVVTQHHRGDGVFTELGEGVSEYLNRKPAARGSLVRRSIGALAAAVADSVVGAVTD